MKILIVEDNPEMRRLLRGLLNDVAEAIYECADGAQALAVYEAHRPDWVLMDIRMHEVDGIAATREITRAWPAAQIMIVSDYDDASLRQAAQLAGASEYVTKENLLEVRRILLAGGGEEHQDVIDSR
jgi:two-component system response regulator DegU